MGKARKEKKPGEKGKRTLIIVLFITALAVSISVCIAFDIGGLGRIVNNYLAALPLVGEFFTPMEQNKTPQQIEQERLDMQREQLERQKENLEEMSRALASWELQLKAKEGELIEQQKAVDELQEKLEARVESIQELASYYERMDSANAVKILDNISDSELVIALLKNMKQQKSSEILALMEPRKAARLMEIMTPRQ